MTRLVVLISLWVTAVVSVPDPTKICMPDTIQFNSINVTSEIFSIVAFDFPRKLFGSITGNTSVVEDLSTLKQYATDATGKCVSSPLGPTQIFRIGQQCLPASAVFLGDIYIGFGTNRIHAVGFELSLGGTTIRYALSDQENQPSYPILVGYRTDKTFTTTFQSEPSLVITQTDIFTIPDPCPPASVVG
ncbi:unnamed protein product [Lymnaea stagnalis]|uniref:Uncharacterized protein n=1 Tax=Lymnaea stagnalis TaxID=6523 RepID=A0AAV2GYW6_LYMST